MNVFNRIVVVLVLLILLAALITLAVVPFNALNAVRTGAEGLQTFLANFAQSSSTLFMVARAAVVLLAVLLFGLLLAFELRRGDRASCASIPKGQPGLRHDRLGGTAADLAHRPACGCHLGHAGGEAHGQSVNVRLDLETQPEVDVPMKTDEVVGVSAR